MSTTGPTTPPTTVPDQTVPATVDDLLDGDATPEQVVDAIENLTADDLEGLTDDEIVTLVDVIASTDLTDEQAEQIAQALSDAPDDVKHELEAAVNVYSGQFDSYVPAGSTVTVAERRTVVAVTAVSFALPPPPPPPSRRRLS